MSYAMSGAAWATSGAVQNNAARSSEWHCQTLASADSSSVQDAPTQVTNSDLLEGAKGLPSYGRVQGYIAPQIGFELRLPASNWNAKFIEVGCSGFCGDLDFVRLCEEPLSRGYACILGDMGHKSTETDGLWAYNNLQAQIDYGVRSAHVTALAGKAITEHYYRKSITLSYFYGCSCGGRQGLVEAQEFPWDFDGIIVGAPPIHFSEVFMN